MLKNYSLCVKNCRLSFHAGNKDRIKQGFTLFEVSISLVLVAFGVISVMTLFPIGIKAEQMARMRIFAAVKAEEILDSFATLPKDNPGIDVEAPNAWEVAVAHRPLVPDLEARMLSSRNGIMSVPMDIVRRLESENDEIQKVIQQGGHLYYSKATGTSGFQESAEGFRNSPKDPLTQRVVFAVLGSAQNNAVSILPQKAWPYYNAYPSPPSYGMAGGYMNHTTKKFEGVGHDILKKQIYFRDAEPPSNPPDSTDVSFMETNDPSNYANGENWFKPDWREYAFSLWEGTDGIDGAFSMINGIPQFNSLSSAESPTGSLDRDIRLVFTNGYRPYLASPLCNYYNLKDQADFGTLPATIPPTPLYFKRLKGAIRYLQAALWYCKRPGYGNSTDGNAVIDIAYYNPSASLSSSGEAVSRAKAQSDIFRSVPAKNKWKYVQAMRFLAHAASCLTGYPETSAAGGLVIPSVDFPFAATDKLSTPSTSTTSIILDQNKVVYYHELAMRLVMLYAASQPYDWGAPRPSQRALFTDNPLMEYDLIRTSINPSVGQISDATSGVMGSQWRPITARPIVNIGRSSSFPNKAIPSATWGNPANFTLTKQFEPAERCRELVFWSVDWLSYVDAETVPGVLDASRIPFGAPMNVPAISSFNTIGSRRLDYWYSRSQFVSGFLNPEMDRAFNGDVSGFPTGFNWPIRNNADWTGQWNGQNDALTKNGVIDEYGGVRMGVNINAGQIRWDIPYLQSGVVLYSKFGADRNGNRTLDRGPVPQSTRLRASLLARYNFYDPRLTLRLR